MKKKIIIIIVIIIILLSIGYLYSSKIWTKKNNSNNINEITVEKKTSIKSNLTIELNEKINDNDYFDELVDETIKEVKVLKDNEIISNIEIGSYDVEIVTDKNSYKTVLNVIDKTSPILELKEVKIKENETYDITSFVDSCSDNSNTECILEYEKEEMSKFSKEGAYDITINASDNSDNKTSQSTKLTIIKEEKKETKTTNTVTKKTVKNDDNKVTTNDKETNNNKKIDNTSNNKKDNDTEQKKEETTNNYVPEKTTYGPFIPPKSHQVTLMIDGGKYITMVNITEGQTIMHIKGESKEGRIFKEWQKDGKTFDPSTPIMEDITLTAVYEEDSNVKVETTKYGTKIITRNNIKTYDYSSYNATTDDLKPEAKTIAASNKNIYQELLKYVNELREKEGSNPLTLDDTLSYAATARAIEMAWSNSFSHTRPNGASCFTIIDEYNIQAFAAGENIALGQTTAKMVFNTWDKSEGHHANMVNKGFTKIGIGKYVLNGNIYWVQLFIK